MTSCPRRLLTPQLSQEEIGIQSKNVISTPPLSPSPSSYIKDISQPETPHITPKSSPKKDQRTVTPECSSSDSPVSSGNTVYHVDTPSRSLSPQQISDKAVDIPRTPTHTVLSPSEPIHVSTPVTPDITQSQDFHGSNIPPKLLDQGTQVTVHGERLRVFVEGQSQVSSGLISPATPLVVCQSLSDVTASSSVEVFTV